MRDTVSLRTRGTESACIYGCRGGFSQTVCGGCVFVFLKETLHLHGACWVRSHRSLESGSELRRPVSPASEWFSCSYCKFIFLMLARRELRFACAVDRQDADVVAVLMPC